ncbi:MAG: metallophosphoesterase [Spirochaetales bacterium]
MSFGASQERLESLWQTSPRRKVLRGERFVILSDLHMGRGDRKDDFLRNGALFVDALEHYYLPRGFTLILNGDIEELLRVPRAEIVRAWKPVYDLFARFRDRGKLIWLIGNHEILPGKQSDPYYTDHFDGESLILELPGQDIFVFHGHQAGVANSGRYNQAIGWSLRLFANSLGIGNTSVAHDSQKKFKLEKAIYEFSRGKKLLSVMGHTHRPLFESLSKQESLGIQIERLCRDFPAADEGRKAWIRRSVRNLRRDYLRAQQTAQPLVSRVYGDMLVPCLFNAGCAVGKRGFTSLELKSGHLGLVSWTSPDRSDRLGDYRGTKPPRLHGEGAYRSVLRRESLDYISSRVELLSDG